MRWPVRTDDRIKGSREDFGLLSRAVPTACRGREDSRVPHRLSLEILRLRHCQMAGGTARIDTPFASF